MHNHKKYNNKIQNIKTIKMKINNEQNDYINQKYPKNFKKI